MWSSGLGIFPISTLMNQCCGDWMGQEFADITLSHEQPCGYIIVPDGLHKCSCFWTSHGSM